jgi:tryptophanyl-tRNA synthetase
VGQSAWPAFEQAPCDPSSFKHLFKPDDDVMCMVVCAVDQYPFFRSVRDFIESLGGKKPIVVASKFLPGLQGSGTKMSASTVEGEAAPSIFLDDSAEEVTRKVRNFAFSGGKDTLKEHREKGGDLSVDIPYIYLLHFLEDEERFKQIGDDYSSGKLLSGEIKQILIDELVKMTKDHQEKRAAISPEELKEFFAIRPLKGGRTDL